MSRLLASGCQSIEASESVIPIDIQGLFPLGLTRIDTSNCDTAEDSREFFGL